jgi:hypothetical protein
MFLLFDQLAVVYGVIGACLRVQKKKRTHLTDGLDPAKKNEPKSFVFRRGKFAVSDA